MAAETPNGIEFSIGAKAYLCSGRMFPAVGMMFGYPTPQGTKADMRTMARCILGITLDWLQANGYVQIWQDVARSGLTKADAIMVRAAYSGAPGLSGQFLENTRWADTSLIDISSRFFPRVEAPVIGFLDNVSLEFVPAGILTRGGYAAHGNVWNAEWLGYLQEAWLPEVWDAWQRVQARPDWPIIDRNIRIGWAMSQTTERDDDD